MLLLQVHEISSPPQHIWYKCSHLNYWGTWFHEHLNLDVSVSQPLPHTFVYFPHRIFLNWRSNVWSVLSRVVSNYTIIEASPWLLFCVLQPFTWNFAVLIPNSQENNLPYAWILNVSCHLLLIYSWFLFCFLKMELQLQTSCFTSEGLALQRE